MPKDVKATPRSYDNRNRREQARQTRRRVIQAARTLFVRDGYDATTIQALADEAGVAVQTIYAAFGSKLHVLKELFDTSIVGDEAATPLARRPDWRTWEQELDAQHMIELFARVNRQIAQRTADVVAVLAAAANGHPDIARMWERAEAGRYEDQKRLADRLTEKRLLREGLSPQRAADITWTLAGPGPYTDLVHRRGWSADDYEQWLTQQLRCALLEP